MMKRRWPQACGRLVFSVVVIIVLTQLHLIISAPTSTTTAPADGVTDHVTSSWQRGSDVTERRQTAPSDSARVHSNSSAAAAASKDRSRRHLYASQGCGPVCNRCRQVGTLLVLASPCDGYYPRLRLFICPSVM